VDRDAYRAFTSELVARLDARPEVLGLVAVGSMAEQEYAPDEWSDHDFYVIVRPGAQERYRANTDWLPHPEEVVWAFRETEHGVKVLYRDGHLLEYAIFDEEELSLAKTNRYQLLLDRAGLEARMAQIVGETRVWAKESSDLFHAGQFLTNLLVGMGRYHRGEALSAHLFVKARASEHLARLLARYVASGQAELADNIDPTRRFEMVYPALGEALAEAMFCEIPEAARRMLAIFQREIPAEQAGVPDEVVRLVAAQIGPGERREG